MKEKMKEFRSHVLVMSLCVLIVTLISVALLSAQSARAQGYPTKPIELIHPYGPGTAMDIVSRLIADIAPKYLGQPMIVNTKPGASASIGAADLIASNPDGYKLLSMVHHYFASTIHTQKLPFNPNDLVPLANFVELMQAMAARADSPFKTLSDLLEYARKNPGRLTWSHGGRGITSHVIAMGIFNKEGVNTVDVPYKGGTVESLTALLGGHVDMASITSPFDDHVKAGKIRLLMVYADQRSPSFPNVPTIVELGYPGMFLPAYTGIYIHKNTPEPIKKILMDALKKVYDDPAFKKGIANLGVEPKWGGPDFINEQIKRSEAIAVPALKKLGMYLDK